MHKNEPIPSIQGAVVPLDKIKRGGYYFFKTTKDLNSKLYIVFSYQIHETIVLDAIKYHRDMENGNFTESFLNNLYKINNQDLLEVFGTTDPVSPEFIRFKKEYKEKKIQDKNPLFYNPTKVEDLTEEQEIIRSRLKDLLKNEKHLEDWNNSKFHIQTLSYRLKNSLSKAAHEFHDVLEEKSFDWGFTDEEILNNLKISGHFPIIYVYNAFIKGSRNFSLTLKIYETVKSTADDELKAKGMEILKLIDKGEYFDEADAISIFS